MAPPLSGIWEVLAQLWAVAQNILGFNGNDAVVQASEQSAQMVVNHFKNYLQRTNMLYAQSLRDQAAKQEQELRRQLREAVAREEREQEVRRRVRAQLKI